MASLIVVVKAEAVKEVLVWGVVLKRVAVVERADLPIPLGGSPKRETLEEGVEGLG